MKVSGSTCRVPTGNRRPPHVWLALFLAFCLVGCSDLGLSPGPSRSLEIELDARRVREVTLLIDEQVRLTASVSSRAGAVSWQSESPEVAGVGGDGVVTARSIGSTRIIASAGSLRDSIIVTVLARGAADGYCAEGSEGLNLAVGEVLSTRASSMTELCLTGGAEYLVVPFRAADEGGTVRVEIEAEGVGGGTASALAVTSQRENESSLMPDSPSSVDRELREREARDLRRLVHGSGAPTRPTRNLIASTPLRPGDLVALNVNSEQTCSDPTIRQARLAAITRHALILVDVANPVGGFSEAQYREIGETFDNLIYPTVTESFGEPTDIDGNGRILILITRAVNEMTDRGSPSFVGGFFFARDLFPRTDSGSLGGCAGSNVAEILYMLAPDPSGAVHGNNRTTSFVANRAPSILAHELQHLIGTSRRLHTLGHSEWIEEFWLNEGLSHIAEELSFYAASGLGPRQDISINTLRQTENGLASLESYQNSNISRYAGYLQEPSANSVMTGADLAMRGASWAFLRYAADRYAGTDRELWKKLIDSPVTGYQNLLNAIGESPLDWMHDWTLSLYADDWIDTSTNFQQSSWHFRSLLPLAHVGPSGYPLAVTTLRTRGPLRAQFDLVGGGAGFVRFSVRSGERGRLTTLSGGVATPPSIRLSVMRTR